jgi:hypothetical protein
MRPTCCSRCTWRTIHAHWMHVTRIACRGVGVLLQADVELGAVVHCAHGIVQLLRKRE